MFDRLMWVILVSSVSLNDARVLVCDVITTIVHYNLNDARQTIDTKMPHLGKQNAGQICSAEDTH